MQIGEFIDLRTSFFFLSLSAIAMAFSLVILYEVSKGKRLANDDSTEFHDLPKIYKSYIDHKRFWHHLHHVLFLLSGQIFAVWVALFSGVEILVVFIGAPFLARAIMGKKMIRDEDEVRSFQGIEEFKPKN